MVWQLGNIISVMEKDCGFKALKKSKELMKGKMKTAFLILVVIDICGYFLVFGLIHIFAGNGIIGRIIGISAGVLMKSLLSLFGYIVYTVFYLVCKSYHHQRIEQSILGAQLDEYLVNYV
ncbi:unnamed protein product [Amaranthus hypochondriacus]